MADKPRWGDYPEKLDLNYITELVKKGLWFNGSKNVRRVDPLKDSDLAPDYMLQHVKEYRSFLVHPDDNRMLP